VTRASPLKFNCHFRRIVRYARMNFLHLRRNHRATHALVFPGHGFSSNSVESSDMANNPSQNPSNPRPGQQSQQPGQGGQQQGGGGQQKPGQQKQQPGQGGQQGGQSR
jgi:hypothetical protein